MLVVSHPSLSSSGLNILANYCQVLNPRPLTETSPNIAIVAVQLKNVLQVLDSFVELLLCAQDTAYGIHRGNGSWIGAKSMLIGLHSFVEIVKKLSKAPCCLMSTIASYHQQRSTYQSATTPPHSLPPFVAQPATAAAVEEAYRAGQVDVVLPLFFWSSCDEARRKLQSERKALAPES